MSWPTSPPPHQEPGVLSARLHAILDEVERLATRGRERLRSHPIAPRSQPASAREAAPPTVSIGHAPPGAWQEPVRVSGAPATHASAPADTARQHPPGEILSAERRLAELIDGMGQRSESMRATLQELSLILNDLEQRFTAVARHATESPRPPDERGHRPPPLRPARLQEERRGPRQHGFAPRQPLAPADSARLVAIEMAVGGSSREEVAGRLRAEFGLERPDTVLDDVFGPGTGPQTRMPWGRSG
jgi:hypothetical protein